MCREIYADHPHHDLQFNRITAGTGFVGTRFPRNEIARKLLAEAGVPVAAPSANRFGHVSPTSAEHVLSDLGAHEMAVIDGGAVRDTCSVGIESTVAKIDSENERIVVFRRGGISQRALEAALGDGAEGVARYRVEVVSKVVKVEDAEEARKAGEEGSGSSSSSSGSSSTTADAAAAGAAAAAASSSQASSKGADLQSPGQLLTHYAPDVPTFLVSPVGGSATASATAGSRSLVAFEGAGEAGAAISLADAVVLDFGGYLRRAGVVPAAEPEESKQEAGVTTAAAASPAPLAYRDIAPAGRAEEAAAGLFAALRWAEGVEGVKHVLVVDLQCDKEEKDEGEGEDEKGGLVVDTHGAEHLPAIFDRMFRAASGKRVVARIG